MADATSATIPPASTPGEEGQDPGRPEAIRRLVELGLKAKR